MKVPKPLVAHLAAATACLLVLCSSALAVDPSSPLIPLTKVVLSNGLTVVVKESHANPVATVNVWVGVGAINEPPENRGVSHFVEHMLFKGTARRGVGQIAAEAQAMGGILNGMTSLDTTNYFICVPSERISQAISLQADAVINPSFDAAQLEQERGVILEEIRMRENDPTTAAIDVAYQEAMAGTAYATNVIGTTSSLTNCTRDVLVSYHDKWYTPNNMVVVVAGDVDTAKVLEEVKSQFGSLKPSIITSQPLASIPQVQRHTVTLQKDVQLAYVTCGIGGPGDSNEDSLSLAVAGMVLGGGIGGRLSSSLVLDKNIALSVQAGYDSFAGAGVFRVMANLAPEAIPAFQTELESQFARLAVEPVTDEELDRAKALVQSNFAYASETTTMVAQLLGSSEMFFDVDLAVNYNQKLAFVTKADIMRVADRYLDSKSIVYAVVRPTEVK